MRKSLFHIRKMDCPSEEQILRMKLEDDIAVKGLEFNIPEKTMTVIHEGDAQEILNKLLPLNFETSLKASTETLETAISSDQDEGQILKILFTINAIMFFVELVSGIYSESIGLVSDSFDMLADASVYLISLYAVGKSLELKKRSAKVNGNFQIVLGFGVLIETLRRFIYGSHPEPSYMIGISILALAANIYCLYLLSSKKEQGVHMKASYICSSNDVIANSGVIIAGGLVYLTGSRIPDLLIGIVVAGFVINGALTILKVAK